MISVTLAGEATAPLARSFGMDTSYYTPVAYEPDTCTARTLTGEAIDALPARIDTPIRMVAYVVVQR
jgi:hypothetical protein